MGFKDTINPLDSTSSFYDWFTKENDEIIAKLNQADVASILAGDGITASNDTNGIVTISMSGKFDGGISFNGPVYFNGSVPGLPNISVKIDEINSTVGGYTFGTPVRVYYDIDTGNQVYEPARANDPDQAEVLGVVSEITDQYAYVTMLGRIQGDFTEVNARGIGLTAGWVYFLSPGSTGMVTDVEPFTGGQVSKPVLMGITANEALVLHMRGNYLNPDAAGVCGGGGEVLIFSSDIDVRTQTFDIGTILPSWNSPQVPVNTYGMDIGDFVSLYTLAPSTADANNTTVPTYVNTFGSTGSHDETGRSRRVPSVIVDSTTNLDNVLVLHITSKNPNGFATTFSAQQQPDFENNPSTPPGQKIIKLYDSAFLGILEDITTDGIKYYYHVRTRGLSKVLPRGYRRALISNNVVGADIPSFIFANNGNVSKFDLSGSEDSFNITNNLPPFQRQYFVKSDTDDITTLPFNVDTIYGRVINGKFYVDYRPNFVQTSSGVNFRSTSSNTFANYQYLINGNFNVWQRDVGKGLTYDATGNVAFADMWKRHDGVSGSDSTKDYYIIRREFNEYQNQIEGSPEYYIDIKALGASAIGYTLPGTSYDAYDHLMIGHVVPDAKRFDNTYLNVKFYAKCSHADYTADAYFSRYSGTQLLDYINLGSLDLTTAWQPFSFSTAIPSLEDKGYSLDIDNDYCEIGIDLIPLMSAANDNSVGITQNVYVSLAAVSATSGSSAIPNSVYPDYEEQLRYCQKFYYSTYGKDDSLGSITMLDSVNPTQNTETIFIMPNKACDTFKWPTEMRTSPTTTFYSPLSGVQGDAYNKTAGFDLKNTSGTIGYNSQIRSAPTGQPTIYGTTSKYGVKVCVQNGAVNYDEIFYHIIADADFQI